jgi:hypothetical protein
MTGHFIFVASDAMGSIARSVPAYELAMQRLSKGFWPLYKGTKNRNAIASGDRVLVYTGGILRFRQCFIATATVLSVEPVGRRVPTVDPPEVITSAPFKIVRLHEIGLFNLPSRYVHCWESLTCFTHASSQDL